MKTKAIVLALAGLGLTTALMASGSQGNQDGSRGDHRGQGMHQQGDFQRGMQHRGDLRAQRMRRGQRMSFMRQMGRQLDLTKEQRRKIRSVFKEERKTIRTQRKAQRGNERKRGGLLGHINPETFMSADHFDKSAFVKTVNEQADKRKTERLEHQAAFLEKIFNILTPEQRVKWIELSKGK